MRAIVKNEKIVPYRSPAKVFITDMNLANDNLVFLADARRMLSPPTTRQVQLSLICDFPQ
jgi:hypothetical protein